MRLNIKKEKKPVVDFLIAVAARGGAENCINMLGKFLHGKGFCVRVIQMVFEGTYWADEAMEFNYVYPSRKDHDLKDFIDGYTVFIQKNGMPDLVIATAWPAMSYVAKRTAQKLGNNFTVASWLHAPLKMYKASNFGDEEQLSYADIHFAISDEIAAEIRAADSEATIYRINNPVDFSKIHKVDIKEPGTLLFVGRLSEEKNIGILICAIAVTKSNWKLRIVGDGDERKKLEELAKEVNVSDKVEFTGWTDDPWKYAQGAYALALSSMYEGSPLVAIEAMSCGLPVIGNVSSRVNEIVVPGQNGYLFEDNNINELARILDMIYEGKFPAISSEVCRDTVKNFEADTALFDFYVKLYATINGRLIKDNLFGSETPIITDKISIIVPCYNVEKYIQRCLDSIISQSIGIKRLEIIAVNDCSTDNTIDALKQYEEKYPNQICIIDCESNSGQSYARNLALEYVSGDFITFVDADDCIAENMLEEMYLSNKCYPCDVVSCDFVAFEENITFDDADKYQADILIIESTNEKRELFLKFAFVTAPWGRLYRSEFVLDNKDIRFPVGHKMEDIFFTYMVLAKAYSWIHIPVKAYGYFINDRGVSRSSQISEYYMDVFTVFKMAMDKYREMGLFDICKREIEFVYYKKVYENILNYIVNYFEELPQRNIETLQEYLVNNFSDIESNEYLTEKERKEISGLLE